MIAALESSRTFRRWLAVTIVLLVSAGLWTVDQPLAFAATHRVEATNFAFTPADLTVRVGDTVTWANGDAESHAVEGGSLSSPEIRAGETYSTTFTAPEDLTYFCRFHTYMTGTIRVVGADEPAAPPPPAPPTTTATTTAPVEEPPPPAEEAPTTTVAPAPAPRTGSARSSAFQEVPDDPSARRPPGEVGSAAPATVPSAPSTPTTSAGRSTTGGTSGSGAGTSSPTTAPRARTSGFQEVPHDPSANHPPGEGPTLVAQQDDGPAGDDGSPPAPAGEPLGDGTFLAPSTDVDGVKEFHLTLDETEVEVSPGVVKPAYAFNGVVPGPVLRVDEGDRVRIVVDNQLPFPTSTHWHGMILPNDQDGVGGITQPHIEPGGRYVYEWTAVATGTHWYHAHSSGRHIGKGLYGMLEVVPEEGDFEADRDYRLMLGDTDLGFTLNGRSFPSTPTLAAAVGETVRLRLVNTGDQVHAMHLHGVPFRVVAQDGIPRRSPESMDTLTIAPGQTYDLLFRQLYPGSWLIHCHMFVHSHMTGDEHPPGESGMNGMVAVLEVNGEPLPGAEGTPDGRGGAAGAAGDLGTDGPLGELLPLSLQRSAEVPAIGLVLVAVGLAASRRRRPRHPSPTTPQHR
jgi:FtsP/CotA-like multicopper oxidase with cupredoxin domain